MRRVSTILAVSATLALAWVLSQVDSKRLCINSTVVKNLVVHYPDTSGKAQYYVFPVCGADWMSNPPPLEIENYEWSSILKRIESLEVMSDESAASMWLMLDLIEPFSFKWRSPYLQVGFEVARAKGQLERAVATALIRQRNVSLPTDLFSIAVAAEVVVQSISPELESPVGRWPEETERSSHWANHAQSSAQYCRSSSIIPDLLSYCFLQNSMANGLSSFSELEPFSFVSVIGRTISEYLVQLPTLERRAAIRKLSGGEFSAEFHQLKGEGASLNQLTKDLGDYIKRFISSVVNRVNNKTLARVMEQSGFHETSFDIFVLDQNHSSVFESYGLQSWLHEHPKSRVVLARGSHKQVLPFEGEPTVAVENLLPMRQLVLISCEAPNLKRVTKYKNWVARLTIVKLCPGEPSPDWGEIVRLGAEDLARRNPDIDLMGLHLPSMEALTKYVGWKPSILRNPHFVLEQMQTNEMVWNPRFKAYQPRAAIEAITLFRWNSTSLSR